MEFIVLGLLMYRDFTIYEINSSFNQGLSLIYSGSYGSIQNAIKKLLKNGMIEFVERVEGGRNKKIYSINDLGKQSFLQWMQGEIQENKLETNMLIKVYFLGLIEEKENKLAILKDILEKSKGALSEIDGLEKALSSELTEDQKVYAKFPLKTLNYGIHAHRVAVEWVEDLYDEIEKG